MGTEPTPTENSTNRDVLDFLGLLAWVCFSVFMAYVCYTAAAGNWMKPSQGRGLPMPMWVTFGLWCLGALFGLAGLVAFIVTRWPGRAARSEEGEANTSD